MFCSECGNACSNNDVFCVKCGATLGRGKETNQSAVILVIAGIAAIAIAFVCLACFVVIPYFSSDRADQEGVVEVTSGTPGSSSEVSDVGGLSPDVSMGNHPGGSTSSGGSSTSPVPPKRNRSVTISTKTSSGMAVSGTVRRDNNDYVIADSSTRTYTVSELRALGLTDAEICVAWNEPYARMGYHFKNSALRAYFNGCSWYKDTGWSGALDSNGPGAINNQRLKTLLPDNSPWRNLALE